MSSGSGDGGVTVVVGSGCFVGSVFVFGIWLRTLILCMKIRGSKPEIYYHRCNINLC